MFCLEQNGRKNAQWRLMCEIIYVRKNVPKQIDMKKCLNVNNLIDIVVRSMIYYCNNLALSLILI